MAKTYSVTGSERIYTECKNALAKCPKIASGYKLLGTIDMANKNYESAIVNYSKAFELNSKDPEIKSAIQRLSIYSVAFLGNRIEINGNKITKQPCRMIDITLKEYSEIDPDVRLAWLRYSLDDISKKTAEEMKTKNPNLEITGTMAAYAEEVDEGILAQAEADSNGKVGAAFEKSAMDASMRHTTVGLAPKKI